MFGHSRHRYMFDGAGEVLIQERSRCRSLTDAFFRYRSCKELVPDTDTTE